MTTSGTTAFTLPIDDIIRKAYARINSPSPTGYELREARKSLDLLLQYISTRNVMLFATIQAEFQTEAGVVAYTMPADTVDVVDVVCRQDAFDLEMEPYAQADYQRLPLKNMTGRPVRYFSDRNVDGTVLRLWPVPDRVYTISYYKIRRLQDTGEYSNTLDVPVKYLPAIVSGLAYYLAGEKFNASAPEMNAAMRETERMRRQELKQNFEEELMYVIDEDRDRASYYISPDLRRY